MTTAVMNNRTMVVGERPRRSLEELVDRVIDALFASNHDQSQETVARRVHDARRLRKAGDLDGALVVFASVEPDTTAPNEVRWAYVEWLSLVRRTYGDRDLLVYSQGAPSELRRSHPTATGPWKSWLCWGWGGSRARWSPRGACGA